MLLTVLVFAHVLGLFNALERVRLLLSPPMPATAMENDIWKSSPGEWVMYAIDNGPLAYYFSPGSVRSFGDKVVYTARFPVKPVSAASQSAYQDDRTLLDCKKSMSVLSERTIYDKSGETISHYKRGDPESLDLSNADTVKTGTILVIAEQIMCDEILRTPVLSKDQLTNMEFPYVATTQTGDGDIFHGPVKSISDPAFRIEVLFVAKFHEDHGFAELFSGQTVFGVPSGYRTFAEPIQLDCKNKKMKILKTDYFDRNNNWEYVFAPIGAPPFNVTEGSIFGALMNTVCGTPATNVGGAYEGMNNTTYQAGGQEEQKILIAVEQNGNDVKVSFHTPVGGLGEGVGKLTGARVESMTLQSTAPGCAGSYTGSLEFAGDTISWSYKGQDCGGTMEGHGTAKRTNS
jgi:hypothetical protein